MAYKIFTSCKECGSTSGKTDEGRCKSCGWKLCDDIGCIRCGLCFKKKFVPLKRR